MYTADSAGPGVVGGWVSLMRLPALAREEWPYAFHLAHREYMRGNWNASELVLLGLLAVVLGFIVVRLLAARCEYGATLRSHRTKAACPRRGVWQCRNSLQRSVARRSNCGTGEIQTEMKARRDSMCIACRGAIAPGDSIVLRALVCDVLHARIRPEQPTTVSSLSHREKSSNTCQAG